MSIHNPFVHGAQSHLMEAGTQGRQHKLLAQRAHDGIQKDELTVGGVSMIKGKSSNVNRSNSRFHRWINMSVRPPTLGSRHVITSKMNWQK